AASAASISIRPPPRSRHGGRTHIPSESTPSAWVGCRPSEPIVSPSFSRTEGGGGWRAERADRLTLRLEHEEEVAVPLDRGAEPLLQVLGRGRGLGRQPSPLVDHGLHPVRAPITVFDRCRPDLHGATP